MNYSFNYLLYITFTGLLHQNKLKYFSCRPSSTTMLHKWDIPTTSHWTWRLPGVSLNCLFFDFELGIHKKANHCDIPPQCSIPNLYYKMDDDNTLPDYICATPNSFGESFWSKYFQSNPISFNQIQIFSTQSKYFQPNPNRFNPIDPMTTCSWSQGCTNATTCPGIRRTPRWARPIDGNDIPTNMSD